MLNKKNWRDHWPYYSYFFVLLGLIGPILFFPQIFDDIHFLLEMSVPNLIGIFIIIIVFVYLFLSVITPRLSKISKKGILVGTAQKDFHIEKPNFKKRKFILFEKIKKIKIVSKDINRTLFMDKILFLRVKTKTDGNYESYINDARGFISKLTEMKKDNLLDKDSKKVDFRSKSFSVSELFTGKNKQTFINICITLFLILFLYFIVKILFL